MAIEKADLRELKQELSEQIRDGFGSLNDRLDTLNGRTRVAEQKIAVLFDREKRPKRSAAAWGGGAAAIVAMIAEALKFYLGSAK